MREQKEVPGGCGDGGDHLDLAVAGVSSDLIGELDGCGELAVFFLLREEGHVVGAGDLKWRGRAGWRIDVLL